MISVAFIALSASAQTVDGTPHLGKQGAATQLIVDGKPFLALGGELTNNAATSLPMMDPIWPKLVAANLNTVLVGVAWGQFEPEEGTFDYTQVDGVIAGARENHMHIVFLWFGAWKNGTSSYPPYWVKKDYTRFPRIQIGNGSTVSVSGPVETLSTLGDATRDADTAAFAALMRHIKEVDGTTHTVVMMQVENEVGVLRDSRDRSPLANRAFAGPVPAELMNYLEAHKGSLIPEFREVWAESGYRKSGTWEQVFGPGKPADAVIPIQTTSPPMSAFDHEVSWRQLHWPSDEIFMAWNYARYVEAVVKAGKAAYDIPMYVNVWLQQPNHAWPGTYPSGGPLPQVHDVWRAGVRTSTYWPRISTSPTSTSSAQGSAAMETLSSFRRREPARPTSLWLSANTTPSASLPLALTGEGQFLRTWLQPTRCSNSYRRSSCLIRAPIPSPPCAWSKEIRPNRSGSATTR